MSLFPFGKKKQPENDFSGVDPRIFNESSSKDVLSNLPYSKEDFEKVFVPFQIGKEDVFISHDPSTTGNQRFLTLKDELNDVAIINHYRVLTKDFENQFPWMFFIKYNNEIFSNFQIIHYTDGSSLNQKIANSLVNLYTDGSFEEFIRLEKIVVKDGTHIRDNKSDLKLKKSTSSSKSFSVEDQYYLEDTFSRRNELWDIYYPNAEYFFKNRLFVRPLNIELQYSVPVPEHISAVLQERSKLFSEHFDYLISKKLESVGGAEDVTFNDD